MQLALDARSLMIFVFQCCPLEFLDENNAFS
jgi:hypothetical protein